MKIQFVCQYYYPDNFLINEISQELVNRGHEVYVLTGLPDYSTGNIPKEYKSFRNRKETINGVKVVRVPTIARKKSKLLRAINYISFYVSSSLYAMFNHFDCDLVFVYQLAPVLMANAGIIIKKKTKKPMLLYCLDPWPDQLKVWNVNENNIIYKIVAQYCKYAYNKADLVAVSSKSFISYLNNENKVDKDKIVYLPQHSEKIDIVDGRNANKQGIDFVYAGSIGIQQNLECLLKAITEISTNKKYHFHICGDGTEFNRCKELSNELHISEYVNFYGRIGKKELSNIYSAADAFVIMLAPEKTIGFSANTVPARFQSYLSMGKPIIASIDGETKQIIENINCGLVSNAGDIKQLAENITEFINNKNDYLACGANAINYFNNNYTKDIVMNTLENILDNLVINGK